MCCNYGNGCNAICTVELIHAQKHGSCDCASSSPTPQIEITNSHSGSIETILIISFLAAKKVAETALIWLTALVMSDFVVSHFGKTLT
jgi:hypothetical protein